MPASFQKRSVPARRLRPLILFNLLQFAGTEHYPHHSWICTVSLYGGTRRCPFRGEDPQWSPDGRLILFHFDHNIYSSTPSGSQRKQLSHFRRWPPRIFSWAPDSRHVLSLKVTDRGLEVGFDPDGPMQRIYEGMVDEPHWSPSADWIAFRGLPPDGEPLGSLYLVRPDGSGLRRLTTPDVDVSDVVWSPDGCRIAYEAYDLESEEASVVVLDLSDGMTYRPTLDFHNGQSGNAYVAGISWLPDGSRLDVALDEGLDIGGTWDEVVPATPDGDEEPVILSREMANVYAVGWSPDGDNSVLLQWRPYARNDRLWLATDRGDKLRMLVEEAQFRGGAWRPRPIPLNGC